jgi:hypothetical protein
VEANIAAALERLREATWQSPTVRIRVHTIMLSRRHIRLQPKRKWIDSPFSCGRPSPSACDSGTCIARKWWNGNLVFIDVQGRYHAQIIDALSLEKRLKASGL